MAILSNGVNINTLFKARTSTKRADVNVDDNGVDISNAYEPIGATTKRADVNIDSGGVDISNLFMDISASTFAFVLPTTDSLGGVDVFGTTGAYVGLNILTTGVVNTYENSAGSTQGGTFTTYDWADPTSDANATDYQFRVGNLGTVANDQPSRTGSAVIIPTSDITTQGWNGLGSTCQYYFSSTAGVSKFCTFKIQLKRISTAQTSATMTVTMTADASGS